MTLLEHYKRMLTTRRIAFILLVIVVFLVGGYLTRVGILETMYVAVLYLVIVIVYSRFEKKLFYDKFKEIEHSYLKEFDTSLQIDTLTEYYDYLIYLHDRAKGLREIQLANLMYLYHSLITSEDFSQLSEVVGLTKQQKEQKKLTSFLYELERLKYVRLGEYDKVVAILNNFLEHYIVTKDFTTDQTRNVITGVQTTINALENKDKEMFKEVITHSRSNHLVFQTISTYIEIKTCIDFGWDDLIPMIKSKTPDLNGDIYLIDYIEMA